MHLHRTISWCKPVKYCQLFFPFMWQTISQRCVGDNISVKKEMSERDMTQKLVCILLRRNEIIVKMNRPTVLDDFSCLTQDCAFCLRTLMNVYTVHWLQTGAEKARERLHVYSLTLSLCDQSTRQSFTPWSDGIYCYKSVNYRYIVCNLPFFFFTLKVLTTVFCTTCGTLIHL
jgi:hypothetical protein